MPSRNRAISSVSLCPMVRNSSGVISRGDMRVEGLGILDRLMYDKMVSWYDKIVQRTTRWYLGTTRSFNVRQDSILSYRGRPNINNSLIDSHSDFLSIGHVRNLPYLLN